MTVNNQATLTGVSGFPASTLLSDEPNLPGFEDPTPLDIVVPPTVTKTALNTPWQAGGTGTFQITVNIPSDIPTGQAIAVHEALPGGFTLAGPITQVPAGSWNCNTASGTCYLNGPVVAGTPASLTFSVHVPEKCASYTNCAEIDVTDAFTPGAAWPDFSSEGQSCVEFEVIGCNDCEPAKLHIEKTHSPATFTNGGTGTISVTVSNTGSDPVIAPIQVNDTLPAGLTMQPGPFSPAADVACVAGPTSPAPQQVHCAYMGNSGGNFSFDLHVNVATDVDKVCNHAAVIKGCCGEEPNDTTVDCIPISKPERGQICGQKFMGKGAEHPLAGWHINIKDGSGNIVGTATTNSNGNYCIPVNPGTYKVSELPMPTVNNGAWIPISPSTGSYPSVSVGSGVVTGIDFHNLKKTYGPVGSDNNPAGMLGPVTKTHSPHTFSTGSKGSFKIKVKNKGKKLAKGMLKVVDHMPGGLSVKTGAFRAGSWTCKGGMVSSSGQDVTCSYNRTLGKHGRATLRLNARVAPKGQFPAGVDVVENCATASVRGAAGVVAAGPKVCDKVKIRHKKSRGLFDLPINIGIGIGGGGAAAPAPVRKTPGAVR